MKIFLTGGTGFIGSNFINLAHKKGLDLVALKKRNSKSRIKLTKQPKWVEGKMSDDWTSELSECDSFIHIASYGVIKDNNNWSKCFEVNVMESINIWKQAIDEGIKKFIIIGSCFEYGISGNNYKEIPTDALLMPMGAYSSSKAAASIAALSLAVENKLDLTILRPFHIYGKGEDESRFWPSLINSSKEGKDFYMTKGEQIRDFQKVEEAVQDILSYHSKSNPLGKPVIKNLGSGNTKSLLEFANEEWERLKSKGSILSGEKPYRKDEVMRYVPKLDS